MKTKLSLILTALAVIATLSFVYAKTKIPQKTAANNNLAIGGGLVKSFRVDLSSTDVGAAEIVNKASEVGANTIYISPWSDGKNNYDYLARLIPAAHEKGLKVYAWFVVGKDTFDPKAHPQWWAKTLSGENYSEEDEPGVLLPVASLNCEDYIDYHLQQVSLVVDMDVDGWVISEPLASWGDREDENYADFSNCVATPFEKEFGVNPKEIFNSFSDNYFRTNNQLYQDWVQFRADVVTNFVSKIMFLIRHTSDKPVGITVFDEPAKDGKLKSLDEIKEWVGMDIESLAALHPDFIEIQDLWADFENPQNASWTGSFVDQFRQMLGEGTPLYISVQGWNVSPEDFARSIQVAVSKNVNGISFYAYHTLTDKHWELLKESWK